MQRMEQACHGDEPESPNTPRISMKRRHYACVRIMCIQYNMGARALGQCVGL